MANINVKVKREYDAQGNLISPTVITQAVIHKKKTLYEELSPLAGKTIAFLGDSETDATDNEYADACTEFVPKMVDISGCTALNYGIAGTRLAKAGATDTTSFISRAVTIPSSVDMVVVMGGINDFIQNINNVPIGTFEDGANESAYTFCSGLHCLCKELYERFTLNGIPVAFIVTFKPNDEPASGSHSDAYHVNADGSITVGKNSMNVTWEQFTDKIRQIAAYWGFPLIDADKHSGFNFCITESANEFTKDGLHMNTKASTLFAKFVYEHLCRIYRWYN